MWNNSFGGRLQSWATLRQQVADLPADECLTRINSWWFSAPWRPYGLHWDDRHIWPNPWQLLEESAFCSLARGLGILYTIAMLEREDFADAVLFETNQDNLVQVQDKKYILNWYSDSVVNISPGAVTNPRNRASLGEILHTIY